jgi:hypothetical protein
MTYGDNGTTEMTLQLLTETKKRIDGCTDGGSGRLSPDYPRRLEHNWIIPASFPPRPVMETCRIDMKRSSDGCDPNTMGFLLIPENLVWLWVNSVR